jgi:hypothetical protein
MLATMIAFSMGEAYFFQMAEVYGSCIRTLSFATCESGVAEL